MLTEFSVAEQRYQAVLAAIREGQSGLEGRPVPCLSQRKAPAAFTYAAFWGQDGPMAMDIGTSPRTDAAQFRNQVARRVADEVRQGQSPCRLAKVTSLSHAFRAPGSHSEIRGMVSALREQGVGVVPGRQEITRRDVLELNLDEGSAPEAANRPSTPGVRKSVWSPGSAGRDEQPLTRDTAPETADDRVLWFDVDPLDSDPSTADSHRCVAEVTALLQPWCPQLDELIVRDLLTPDAHPKVETYGDERSGIRSISAAAVVARELPDDDDDFDGVDEQLIFQMVELIVGPGWILTCWHPSQIVTGSEERKFGPSLLREPFLSHVAHRWVHDEIEGRDPDQPKNSTDLGLYLARSLVATYGASIRMMQRWVSAWEVSFYKSLSSSDKKPKKLKEAAVEISNFLSMVGEFSRGVSAFRLAGEEMPNKSWFAEALSDEESVKGPGEHATALAAAVETAEEKMTQLAAGIRADMDLLMIQSQATQQESAERLQAYLGKITGLVLVPTFVAGLFGANTALPGQGSWGGFELMLLLMMISGIASYLVIRRLVERS